MARACAGAGGVRTSFRPAAASEGVANDDRLNAYNNYNTVGMGDGSRREGARFIFNSGCATWYIRPTPLATACTIGYTRICSYHDGRGVKRSCVHVQQHRTPVCTTTANRVVHEIICVIKYHQNCLAKSGSASCKHSVRT